MGQLSCLTLFITSICFHLFPVGRGELVLGRETDDFDFDGLPGAQHEFKIEIRAGQEECFYQKIKKGGKIFTRFQVLKGGDGNTALYISKPAIDGEKAILMRTNFVHGEGLEFGPVEETWTYEICLDNKPALVAKKLVHFYLMTVVEHEWHEFREELESIELRFHNFANVINTVRKHVSQSLIHVAQGRFHVVSDWYVVKNNLKYVQWWSICQCVVVVVSSITQVYVLRRLFRTPNVTPTFKPRA